MRRFIGLAGRRGRGRARRGSRRGFTLLELLLATTLAAVLMGGVLAVTAALSRDRRRLELAVDPAPSEAVEVVRRDLASAVAIVGPADGTRLELIGYSALNPQTLAADNRLCRVLYRVVRRGESTVLTREQAYLDDPVRPDRWSDVVAVGTTRLVVTPLTPDEPVRLGEDVEVRIANLAPDRSSLAAVRPPARLRVRIESRRAVHEREVVLR